MTPAARIFSSRHSNQLKILVENSGYDLSNLGDVCMLQVAFERLRARFPDAEIEIITRDPEKLGRYCVGARPIAAEKNSSWQLARNIYYRGQRVAPSFMPGLQRRAPGVYRLSQRFRAKYSIAKTVVDQADVFVASGGGFITDVFGGQAWSVLERIGAALNRGARVALFGQGIGPLRDAALFDKAREVLPRADVIALREKLTSLPILERLKVPRDRVFVTGDDVIESAYARRNALGDSLGVNLRVAGYTGITAEMIGTIRNAMLQISRALNADLLGLPIFISETEEYPSDSAVLNELDAASWGSKTKQHQPQFPAEIIDRISECRIVVTGSYHVAVFALSQGVPALCLANSEYYESKFHGLADMFGTGIEVICLSDHDFQRQLIDRSFEIWRQAETFRPPLLHAAEQQIGAGKLAYDRLREVVGDQYKQSVSATVHRA